MREAILHYEGALMKEANSQKLDNTSDISKIYAETFMKLFNTKIACCDWKDYF
jgi:hypothetical protein